MDINPMILMRRNPVPKSVIQLKHNGILFEKLDRTYSEIRQLESKMILILEEEYSKANASQILELKRAIFNKLYKKAHKLMHKEFFCDFIKTHYFAENFLSQLDKLIKIENEIEAYFESVSFKARTEMQTAALEFPEIANYMIAINKNIYYKLKNYLNTPVALHKSNERKLESTLYNIISRSALKTSPFLDVTQVGVTKAVENEYKDTAMVKDSRRHVSLNYTFLYRIAFAFLERSNAFYEHAKFRLPPFSIVEKEGKKYISYVGTMDDTTSSKIYKSKEVTADLKINSTLEKFFLEKDIHTDIRLEEFCDLFQGELSKEKSIELFKKYVQIGLFTSVLNFDESNDFNLINDILVKTKVFLSEADFELMNAYYQKIFILSRSFTSMSDYEERYECYLKMSQIVDELNANYNLTFSSTYVFYEDGVLEAMQFLDENKIRQHYPQMQLLQKFTIIFDVNIRLQMEIAERFKLVYHKGFENIDDIFFSVLFETSKAMQGYWGDPFYTKQNILSKNIVLLDRLKLEFIEAFNALVSSCDEPILDIEPLILAYVNKIPKKILDMCDLSSTFFVQFNEDTMILNDLYDGHEKYKARFMNYFQDYLIGDVNYLKFVEDYYKAQNYMEYKETFGFNGNAKSTSLENTCYTVGVGNTRFDEHKTENTHEIEELFIEIDDKFRLVDKNGKNVKICHRGSLVPIAMPGYISLLLQLFSSGRMMFSYSQLNKGDITPRLRVNKVVVSRRRKKLRTLMPHLLRGSGESDFEYYRRINLFFTNNALDKSFFVSADKNLSTIKDKFLMGFKPMYVDIANPIALKIFEKEILTKAFTELFEALFYEEYLSNHDSNAIEYDIEIYKKEERG